MGNYGTKTGTGPTKNVSQDRRFSQEQKQPENVRHNRRVSLVKKGNINFKEENSFTNTQQQNTSVQITLPPELVDKYQKIIDRAKRFGLFDLSNENLEAIPDYIIQGLVQQYGSNTATSSTASSTNNSANNPQSKSQAARANRISNSAPITNTMISPRSDLSNIFEVVLYANRFKNVTSTLQPLQQIISKCRILDISLNCLQALSITIKASLDSDTLAFQESILQHLPNLERLSLAGNMLPRQAFEGPEIEEYFANMKNLTHLDLRCNDPEWGNIPVSILRLIPQLSKLNMKALGLNSLEGITMDHTKNLSYVNFAENNIVGAVPAAFGNLPQCIELYLFDNQLQSLPPIQNWERMRKIDLSLNLIEAMPEGDYSKLRNITEVYLSFNKISSIPKSFATQCTCITQMDLSHNKIKEIPSEFKFFKHLELLDVSDNCIESFPSEALEGMEVLGDLRLSGNRLTDFPKSVRYLQIYRLRLGYNQLTHLNFLYDPSEPNADEKRFPIHSTLQELFLNGNQLKKVPFDAFFKRYNFIKILYAGDNKFTEFPFLPAVRSLKSILHLSLWGNQISSICLTQEEEAALKEFQLEKPVFQNTNLLSIDFSLNDLPKKYVDYIADLKVEYPDIELKYHANQNDESHMMERIQKSKRFHIGYSDMVGTYRGTMEDAITMKGNLGDYSNLDICCVFDGHGGTETANFVASKIDSTILHKFHMKRLEPITAKTLEKIACESIEDVNEELAARKIEDGSTAVLALLYDQICCIVNIGDSRAVLSRCGKAVRISQDHKSKDMSEIKRIHQLGSPVIDGRVMGLAVTRAFGDFVFHPYVTIVPHTHSFDMTKDDEFIILACDGVWDIVSDEFAVELVGETLKEIRRDHPDWNDAKRLCFAASRLRDYSFANGSTDNISVIVVELVQQE